MRREDDQQLWDLLGEVPRPQISPFFTRNVARRIRQEPQRFERVRTWFSLRRLIPASGLAIAVIGAMIVMQHPTWWQRPSESEPEVVAKVDPQDYEVVADLDELLASDENSLWDENENQTL
jgi:hypothetical protein